MTSTPTGNKLLCIGGPLHGQFVEYGGCEMKTVDQQAAMDDALSGAYSPKGVAPLHTYTAVRITALTVAGREPASRTVYAHNSISGDQARHVLTGMVIDAWIRRTPLEPTLIEPVYVHPGDTLRVDHRGLGPVRIELQGQ